MEDNSIVDLYWARDERAIEVTSDKYGRYCYSIAYNILGSKEDSDECVNDTYLGAWNSMPPHRPAILSTFLGKITRSLSLKKWRDKTRLKRGGCQADITLEELQECIPTGSNIEEELEAKELVGVVNEFLKELPLEERRIFLRRYWYFDSIEDICKRFGYGKSKVKMKLFRTREKLMKSLEGEGVKV